MSLTYSGILPAATAVRGFWLHIAYSVGGRLFGARFSSNAINWTSFCRSDGVSDTVTRLSVC